jgi:hypothetical protein
MEGFWAPAPYTLKKFTEVSVVFAASIIRTMIALIMGEGTRMEGQAQNMFFVLLPSNIFLCFGAVRAACTC